MNELVFQYTLLCLVSILVLLYGYNAHANNRKKSAETAIILHIEKTIERHDETLVNSMESTNKLTNVLSKLDFKIEKFEAVTKVELSTIKSQIKDLQENEKDIYSHINEIEKGCAGFHYNSKKANTIEISGNGNVIAQDLNKARFDAYVDQNFSD